MKKYGRNFVLSRADFKAIVSSVMFIVIGCIIGNVVAGILDVDRQTEIYDRISGLFMSEGKPQIDKTALFYESLKEYTISFIIISVCSFSVYFVPVIFGKLIFDGFKLGLASGLLVKFFGGYGFLYTCVLTFFQNVIYVPLLVVCSVYSVKQALAKHKTRKKAYVGKILGNLCFVVLLSGLCGVFESYIASYFILKLM